MGYSTDFSGEFKVTPPLQPQHIAYLKAFNETRRMKRIAEATNVRHDPIREAVGLPVGVDGSYFVGESGFAGQDNGPDVKSHNIPPEGQPGLWCQWTPNDDGTSIMWDEGEKFYSYNEWLAYLIEHFLAPWGYTLNGEVTWQGEESDDRGIIYAKDNEIAAVEDQIVNTAPW